MIKRWNIVFLCGLALIAAGITNIMLDTPQLLVSIWLISAGFFFMLIGTTKMLSKPKTLRSKVRKSIESRVKMEVWRRDQGRCVQCGSKEKLEYDHIIPFVLGGSNTARNIQLLCEKCNRSKSNKIK